MNDYNNDSLKYHPSKVSWAVARFIAEPPAVLARAFVVALAIVGPSALLASFLIKHSPEISFYGAMVSATAPTTVVMHQDGTINQVLVVPHSAVRRGQQLLVTENSSRNPAATTGHSLVAPVEGIVSNIYIRRGEKVRRGEPVLNVVSTESTTKVEVEVPSRIAGTLAIGTPVKVLVTDRNTEVSLPGQITGMRPLLNRDGDAFKDERQVEIQLDSSGTLPTLLPGQHALVKISSSERRIIQIIFDRIFQREIAVQ